MNTKVRRQKKIEVAEERDFRKEKLCHIPNSKICLRYV